MKVVKKFTKNDIKPELEKTAKACYTPYETIAAKFAETFKGKFVQKDPQFKDLDARIRYCLAVTSNAFKGRRKTEPYDIIPVGYSSIKVNNKSIKYREIIVVWENKQKKKILRKLLNYSEFTPVLDQLYKGVQLSTFSNTKKDTDILTGDDRASFDDVEYLPEFDFNKLNLYTELDLDEIIDDLSKTDKNGYTDSTDWKAFDAYITFRKCGETKKGGTWGLYRISKPMGAIEVSTNMIFDDIAAWIAPDLIKYETESIVKVFGPTSVDDDGTPSINVYRIEPKTVILIEEE